MNLERLIILAMAYYIYTHAQTCTSTTQCYMDYLGTGKCMPIPDEAICAGKCYPNG